MEWQEMLDSGKVSTQAAIARQEEITRTRVFQILSLLSLAPKCQKYILSMPDMVEMPSVTERSLRPITSVEDQRKQLQAFIALEEKAAPICER